MDSIILLKDLALFSVRYSMPVGIVAWCNCFIDRSKAFLSYLRDELPNERGKYSSLLGPRICRGQQGSIRSGSNVPLPPLVDDRLSHAHGRSLKGLKYCTLARLMDAMSEREPDSLAVVAYDEGISKTFAQLNSDINRLVNGMAQELNLSLGDRVALFSYNTYQFLLVQFACNKLGLTLIPLNPSYKADEFFQVLVDADPKSLFLPGKGSKQSELNDHWSIICDETLADLQERGSIKSLRHIVLLDGKLDSQDVVMKDIKMREWPDIFTNKDFNLDPTVQEMIDRVRPEDVYGIYYTSGTTGVPKGAVVSQFTVINNAILTCNRLFQQRGPKYTSIRPNVCLPLPLFHEFAGVLGALLPFTQGGSIVLPAMRYNMQTIIESIMKLGCNAALLAPTILSDLLRFVEETKLSEIPLKVIVVGGSAAMPELALKTQGILPDLEELRIGYGTSENGVVISVQSSQEPEETRAITVGPPLDFTEIRIVNTSTGETALLGQSGEVQTRGFNTMIGYHNQPAQTDAVITKSRWYKTGDLGILNKQGSLQLIGRIKDTIIKGGENIYPAEVEAVLNKHQAIEAAHVFGVPDGRLGEEVCAWVKLVESIGHTEEAEMRAEMIVFCRNRLAYFKAPKYIVFVDEFPLTAAKKVKKFEMRARTVEILDLL